MCVYVYSGQDKYSSFISVLPPLPPSFDEENQLAMLDRIIKLDMNPITGFVSKYNK